MPTPEQDPSRYDDFNEDGLDRHLLAIAAMVREIKVTYDGDVAFKCAVVELLSDALDKADDNDLFGTEGWRRLAGLTR